MSTSLLTPDETTTVRWNAVILYDQFRSGRVAKALLDRVASQGGTPDDPEINLWRFDVMQESIVADEALEKARDAQIVFLAAQGAEEPPEWLIHWLEEWASQRNVENALLAAWCGEHSGGELPKGIGSLRQLAGKHGVDFLCADEPLRREVDGSWSTA